MIKVGDIIKFNPDYYVEGTVRPWVKYSIVKIEEIENHDSWKHLRGYIIGNNNIKESGEFNIGHKFGGILRTEEYIKVTPEEEMEFITKTGIWSKENGSWLSYK